MRQMFQNPQFRELMYVLFSSPRSQQHYAPSHWIRSTTPPENAGTIGYDARRRRRRAVRRGGVVGSLLRVYRVGTSRLRRIRIRILLILRRPLTCSRILLAARAGALGCLIWIRRRCNSYSACWVGWGVGRRDGRNRWRSTNASGATGGC